VYHEGFRLQAAKWPHNPLNAIIEWCKHLPPSTVVADFGCGEGRLAQSIPLVVHSFDLHPINDWITVADIAHVPLDDSSVDVGVFCLSLMGTNLVEYLVEANRVLRKGGMLKIAEVVSRIPSLPQFLESIKGCGFDIQGMQKGPMFVAIDCVKSSRPPHPSQITLKPCVYKKR
jgi:ubiquinone/menaquinone biosynthesis C-methylase UbiE